MARDIDAYEDERNLKEDVLNGWGPGRIMASVTKCLDTKILLFKRLEIDHHE